MRGLAVFFALLALPAVSAAPAAAAGWSAPSALSGAGAERPTVAAGGIGEASVLFRRTGSPSQDGVLAATHTAGAPWTLAVLAATEPTGGPDTGVDLPGGIAADAAGAATAAWSSSTSTSPARRWIAERPAGSVFARPIDLGALARLRSMDVAVSGTRRVVITQTWTNLYRYLTATTYQAGAQPSETTLSGCETSDVVLAGHADGRLAVAWAQPGSCSPAETTDLAVARMAADGRWESSIVSSPGALACPFAPQGRPRSAVFDDDRLLVLFAPSDEPGLQIIDANAGPSCSAVVTRSPVTQARLATGPDGTTVAAWIAQEGGRGIVRLAAIIEGQPSGPAITLSGAGNASELAEPVIGPDGSATVSWTDVSADQVPRLMAAVREPGGSIEPAQMLSAGPAFGPDLAVDARGDVVAVWQRGNDPARSSVEWSVLDHGAPALSAPRLPARAVAGRPADFAVTAVDTWPGVSVSWTFDDGATATGAQVAHVFAAPGEHRIAVSATDPSGNQARDSAVVTVAPRPPRIVSFKLRPTRFVARTSGPAIRSRPGGTRLLLSASGADTIRFTVRRRITARRWRTLRGSFSFRASDRKHRWFSGRVGGRTLRPGSYRLIAVAANREGQRSRPVERAFRILPR